MGDYLGDMKYEDMTPSEDYSRGHAAGRRGKEQEVDAAYHSGYNDGYAQAKRDAVKLIEKRQEENRELARRILNGE